MTDRLIVKVGNWWPLIIVFGVGVATWLLLDFAFPFGSDSASRLCDQAVATLLHSKDQVEVVRAGIIVYEVGCGISRRWKAEQPK
jgi:hypothetical protein